MQGPGFYVGRLNTLVEAGVLIKKGELKKLPFVLAKDFLNYHWTNIGMAVNWRVVSDLTKDMYKETISFTSI
jgi:hypothetical protein